MAEPDFCNGFWRGSSNSHDSGEAGGKLCLHGDGRSVERWSGADAEISGEWRKNHISGGWNSRPRDR